MAEYRAGFVSFVGRPNVGKSTLTNALVGEKVAITSSKPQTTRRAIRGIVHREHGQLILVDTPGHAPPAHAARRAPELARAVHPRRRRRDRASASRRTSRSARATGSSTSSSTSTRARRRSRSSRRSTPRRRPKVAEQLLAVSRAARVGGDHPGLGAERRAARRARRRAARAACRSRARALPGRDAVTDEDVERAHRGVRARGRARGRLRRAAALDRGDRRRHDRARGQGPRRDLREPLSSSATARRASSSARAGPACARSAPRARAQIEQLARHARSTSPCT